MNKKGIPSHFWSSHSQTISLFQNIFVWRGILKHDNHQVQKLKNVKNVLCPPLSCINLHTDDLCKKSSSVTIPLAALGNGYKFNCFLLIFFALLFPLRGFLLLYSYFRGLYEFVGFRHKQNCLLRFEIGCLHVLTSVVSMKGSHRKNFFKMGRW